MVTGASQGVDLYIATGLADLGCNIVLHSRSKGNTVEVTARLREKGVSVIVTAAELNDQSQVDAMLNDILSQVPQIDILYNNAAIMTPYRSDPWQTTAEDYRTSFEINVISLARICNRLVPRMIKQKWGRVVNLTSGIADQPQLTAYAVFQSGR